MTHPIIQFKLGLRMNSYSWWAPKEPVWLLRAAVFSKAIIETLTSDGAVCTLQDGSLMQAKKTMLFQRDPAHRQFNEDRWDLMDTDVLNEPEILQTLKLRLENNRIYTFVENSLLAVNPYYPINSLYSNALKQFYGQRILREQENIRDFEPHLYAITAHALRELSSKGQDQAVVISGESGSGKTEANKECLRFLQYHFHQEKGLLDEAIDNMLSLSTPILQAFGNAKTIRNNNSSRFGKYLNISLSPALQVKHVQIYNYILEKSRIISRAENQQNFHIFYELLKGLSKAESQKYFLSDADGKQYTLEDFNYLKNGKPARYEQHPDISFQKVKDSLNQLRDKNAFDFACRLLAAILLFGNLVPQQIENEDCCRIQNQEVLAQICTLLQLKQETLLSALTCYPIRIGSETLTKYFNIRQVQQLIHSLAKILYERLFQWTINEINSISPYSGNEQLLHLGFLDIYGFEILEQNSLEQLFINYTNERLHQIYLAKIFKEEETLFAQEGLTHKFRNIPFTDNLPVLELIDYEQLSIFNLLDQWCAVASPDDSVFITKLRHKHKKHICFPPANFNLPSTTFLIRHSPKDIEYSVIGFRDKNKDLVREQIKVALRTTALTTLAALFEEADPPDPKKANHKMRKFLSFKFRHEMSSLMEQLLGKCDLHFIRCVKSNSSKLPLTMQDEVVYNQICYLGLLDTIRLKKIGYCIKLHYDTVDRRFQWLVRHYYSQPAFSKEITKALREFLPRFQMEEMLFGKSMVFFKDYVYSALTRKYDQYLKELNRKCSMIQRCWMMFKLRRRIVKMRKSVSAIVTYLKGGLVNDRHKRTIRGLLQMQSAIRSKLAHLRSSRRIKNLTTLQCYIKKELCRAHRFQMSKSLQTIVSFFRRLILRKRVRKFAAVNRMRTFVIERSWMKIVMARKYKVETYLLGFLTQIGSKNQILAANTNTRNKLRERAIRAMQCYVRGCLQADGYTTLAEKIVRLQCICRSWIYRNKYCKLREAAIIIQRAYREYYFNKNTARQIFDINFGQYRQELEGQNLSMRKFLYENSVNDSLKILYTNYLAKFREKCCLFYLIVDFQAFINLQHSYPDNSWLLNYFQVVKEGFEKDCPLQGVEVSETFTVATTTNRVYVWGMNSEVDTLEKMVAVRSNGQARVERVSVSQQEISLHYEGAQIKQQRSYSTVNRTFTIDNGKLVQNRQSNVKLIKMPLSNERIIEVACGSSHVILRTINKKVYTFGNGRFGQLGHGNFSSVDHPKLIEFGQFKNYLPLQITAGFNSSIVLLANKKIYWFGSNGTIDKVKTPVVLEIGRKFEEINRGDFAAVRVRGSWSRSTSLIGVTFMSFNGKLATGIGLRNKVHELMIAKWHEQGIDSINPPFNSAYSDYLEECHVKLPRNRISIEPESRKLLKKMEEKVSSIQSDKYNDFSFSDPNFK